MSSESNTSRYVSIAVGTAAVVAGGVAIYSYFSKTVTETPAPCRRGFGEDMLKQMDSSSGNERSTGPLPGEPAASRPLSQEEINRLQDRLGGQSTGTVDAAAVAASSLKEIGVTMTIPSGWSVADKMPMPQSIILVAFKVPEAVPISSPGAEATPPLSLIAEDLRSSSPNPASVTPESYASHSRVVVEKMLKEAGYDVSVVRNEPCALGPFKWVLEISQAPPRHMMEMMSSMGIKPVNMVNYVAVSGNIAYTLQYMGQADSYKALLPKVEGLASSSVIDASLIAGNAAAESGAYILAGAGHGAAPLGLPESLGFAPAPRVRPSVVSITRQMPPAIGAFVCPPSAVARVDGTVDASKLAAFDVRVLQGDVEEAVTTAVAEWKAVADSGDFERSAAEDFGEPSDGVTTVTVVHEDTRSTSGTCTSRLVCAALQGASEPTTVVVSQQKGNFSSSSLEQAVVLVKALTADGISVGARVAPHVSPALFGVEDSTGVVYVNPALGVELMCQPYYRCLSNLFEEGITALHCTDATEELQVFVTFAPLPSDIPPTIAALKEQFTRETNGSVPCNVGTLGSNNVPALETSTSEDVPVMETGGTRKTTLHTSLAILDGGILAERRYLCPTCEHLLRNP